ncbi:MAG TPA: hypothetical protein VFF33_14280 [Ignavibacteriaceae bacterium]|nr:hypothetical protein [Ignavibacteriaceae bacterium]
MIKISTILIAISLVFASCKSDNTQKNDNSSLQDTISSTPKTPQPPAQIQMNRSNVIIEVQVVQKNADNTFSLKGKVLEVKEVDNYPSIAVQGETYLLKPFFRTNEDMKLIESEQSKNMKELANLKSGDKFQAYISLENNGWVIQEVLKK